MNTNSVFSAEDLKILSHREEAIMTAMANGEKAEETAKRYGVTSSRINSIRQTVLAKLTRSRKLKELKESADKVGLYMLRLEEVFSGRTVSPLKKAGYERIGDLRGKSDYDLLRLLGLGKSSIREIGDFFTEYELESRLSSPTEETLEERVAKFIFSKCLSQRGCGIVKATSAARLAIASGLVTEEGFKLVLSKEAKLLPG